MIIRKSFLVVISGVLLGACASKNPPVISYDPVAFKPAAQLHDSAAVRPTVVSEAFPAPDPVGRLPPDKPDTRAPTARVQDANRAAMREPTGDGYINAVQIYPFSDNALYRLYAAPEQVSDIALQPGEVLSAISAGDTVRWAVGDTASGNGQARQVHVLVKPFASGLKTNLVILTDRRTYHLELESTGHTSMAAISWSYPQDDLIAAKSPQTVAASTVDSGVSVDSLHFRYAISGDTPPWRPLRAFDDGSKVYIEFPERIDQGEAPPLFVIGTNGSSDLVNYRVRGNYYVVDRLFAAAELRLGQDKQQIVRISRTDTAQKKGALASLFGG